MDPILNVSYATIASFFESAEGNFRNAVYVSCSCEYTKESGCEDFLFVPVNDCIPSILPVSDAEKFIGFTIDKTEFPVTMDSRSFIRIYSKWIESITPSSRDCPVHQLLHLMNQPKSPT